VAQVDSVTHARAGFAFGTVVFAVWGASRGAAGLMLALNRLFGRVETRSWLHRQAIAIALTVACWLPISSGKNAMGHATLRGST
jgi:uncharacterized BrkB/YihY/UPF0761 family membrane protein